MSEETLQTAGQTEQAVVPQANKVSSDLAAVQQPVVQAVQTAAVPVKKKRRSRRGTTTKSKKKEAVARAVIKKGKGVIRINKRNLHTIQPKYVYEFIKEPLHIAGKVANDYNIDVHVKGGGYMGQAVAVRAAIAKALVEETGDEKLKGAYLAYDRMLLVDDSRRVEPKKPLGPKARRKKQLSRR